MAKARFLRLLRVPEVLGAVLIPQPAKKIGCRKVLEGITKMPTGTMEIASGVCATMARGQAECEKTETESWAFVVEGEAIAEVSEEGKGIVGAVAFGGELLTLSERGFVTSKTATGEVLKLPTTIRDSEEKDLATRTFEGEEAVAEAGEADLEVAIVPVASAVIDEILTGTVELAGALR